MRFASSRSWLIVRGILGLVFGVLALVLPLQTVSALIMLFGIYLILDAVGLLASATALHRRSLFVGEGVLTLIAGIVCLVLPAAAATAVVYLVAIWALISGALRLKSGFQYHGAQQHETWLLASGVVSLLLGILLLMMPAAGIVVMSWCLAFYAFALGVSTLSMAMDLDVMPDPHTGEPLPGRRQDLQPLLTDDEPVADDVTVHLYH